MRLQDSILTLSFCALTACQDSLPPSNMIDWQRLIADTKLQVSANLPVKKYLKNPDIKQICQVSPYTSNLRKYVSESENSNLIENNILPLDEETFLFLFKGKDAKLIAYDFYNIDRRIPRPILDDIDVYCVPTSHGQFSFSITQKNKQQFTLENIDQ